MNIMEIAQSCKKDKSDIQVKYEDEWNQKWGKWQNKLYVHIVCDNLQKNLNYSEHCIYIYIFFLSLDSNTKGVCTTCRS